MQGEICGETVLQGQCCAAGHLKVSDTRNEPVPTLSIVEHPLSLLTLRHRHAFPRNVAGQVANVFLQEGILILESLVCCPDLIDSLSEVGKTGLQSSRFPVNNENEKQSSATTTLHGPFTTREGKGLTL